MRSPLTSLFGLGLLVSSLCAQPLDSRPLECTISTPDDLVQRGDIPMTVSVDLEEGSLWDVSLQFTIDGGLSFAPCSASPDSPLPIPATNQKEGHAHFVWDSSADLSAASEAYEVVVEAVVTQIGVETPAICTTEIFVVNAIRAPTCNLRLQPGTASGDVAMDLYTTSAALSATAVDVNFHYSLDQGITYLPCTPVANSPLANPALGAPLGLSTFLWDTVRDGIALDAAVTSVLVRATIHDRVALPSSACLSLPFSVDNSGTCHGPCGDCDMNGSAPDVLDSLVAAQIASGLGAWRPRQIACCDTDANGSVTIVDSLRIAQKAAGLEVAPACH